MRGGRAVTSDLSDPRGSSLLHEVRNCLAAMRGNVQLLKAIPLPESALGPVLLLERVSASLQQLADETLEPGEPAHGTQPASLSRAAEICAQDHFRGRSISVRRWGLDGVGEDEWRLVQVFLNLFRNAFEAGAGRIDVDCVRFEDRIVARVRDDGFGCPEQALPRLFDPGFSLGKPFVGTGLGLHFVRTVVEARRGTVTARNRPGARGAGMEFLLAYPAPAARSVLY